MPKVLEDELIHLFCLAVHINKKTNIYQTLKYESLEKVYVIIFVQVDTSKMGQTLRLNPCFNTVPIQLCFQITVHALVIIVI